jgi:hypothetical protein
MSKLLTAGAVGALALGAAAAHASIQSGANGSGDAIVFAEVLNSLGSAAVASYAGDTGVSVNSLIAGLSGTTTVLVGDANLTKLFAADAPGDILEFAVMGGQNNNGSTATAGSYQYITSVANNSTTQLNQKNNSSLLSMATDLQQDVGTVNSNINNPAVNSIEGPSPASAGVWDVNNTTGTAYWGLANLSNGSVSSTVENLYYLTGGGGGNLTHTKNTLLSETATLTSSGLVLTVAGGGGGTTTTPPTVPLPPAVWLLGSGLLGLAGVARRKAKA